MVWVTGAGGFIGSHVVRTAPSHESNWRILAWTREQLDLTDGPAVQRVFTAERPSAIVHCAALSRAAACQEAPGHAERLNVEVTRRLCDLASEADIPLLFLSTDIVFDGRKGSYAESDPVNPLSVYGETKARAEIQVLKHPRHAVVRLALTAGVSPSGDRSFSEELRRKWARGETVRLFRDEFRSPLPAPVVARALWEVLLAGYSGLFHLGGSEKLSRWEIGQLVANRWQVPMKLLEAGSCREYDGPPRPADTSLDCGRLQALLSFPLPGLGQWTRQHPDEPL